jgi:hypothetical protein
MSTIDRGANAGGRSGGGRLEAGTARDLAARGIQRHDPIAAQREYQMRARDQARDAIGGRRAGRRRARERQQDGDDCGDSDSTGRHDRASTATRVPALHRGTYDASVPRMAGAQPAPGRLRREPSGVL